MAPGSWSSSPAPESPGLTGACHSCRALIAEDLFQAFIKSPRDPEGQFQGRRVMSRFDGDDGLPGRAYLVRQLLLRELAVLEAQLAQLVFDLSSHDGSSRCA